MSLDNFTRGLEEFAADAKKAKSKRQPSPLDYRFDGMMLTLDPSISKTGWAYLLFHDGKVSVEDAGLVETAPRDKGYADFLLRGQELAAWVVRYATQRRVDRIAHETPTMGGGMGRGRTDASLAASCFIEGAAVALGVPVGLVHAKHARSVVMGNGNASKPEVKNFVSGLVTPPSGCRWNQDITDAVLLGLCDAVEYQET